ncbi:kinetochore protein Spc25 [Drosophila grimshawi]|uniref:Kinetochore protein Spc25 n=1 Tax=Drosophila grimshawi TaxID=7222 RepID=SPC25_DROGR|nr:kinetochore protein Spc25 [Drosophila grimshawi]B4JEY0.1 RecName: Full=Kinetochore protein Spc25 [Drosophila grimshawi]EDV93261.1 GH18360 [Drosophila grimshawi]
MTEQFDTRRRLMAMFRNEMRMEKLENTIAKKSTKFHTNSAALMTTIDLQQRKFEKLNALITRRCEDINTRTAFTRAVREKLAEERQKNAEMQAQLEKANDERIEQMDCVRTLSDASNTFINPSALPARLKGVTVLREEGRWISLDYDGDDLKGLSTFWAQAHSGSASQKWQQLLSMDKAIMPTLNDKGNVNVSVSSIIEIDLTASPSHK